MKNKSDKIFIFIISLILASSIVTTYAFFNANISGNVTTKNINANTVNIELQYSENDPTINVSDILPGWTGSKTIKVINNGDIAVNYKLVWQSLTNNFDNNFVYSINCSNNCSGLSETFVPKNGSNLTIINNISISAHTTQTYTISFSFKETNTDQSANIGASFTGTLGILEI